jgi:hypothetical protein
MTSGSFTSTADIDFYIDVDAATGAELVMLSDNITTRHQVRYLAFELLLVAMSCSFSASRRLSRMPLAS